jgi:hypothetical protein
MQNKPTLPPKRWQDGDDPIYDTIRHKRWFGRGLKRKHHIPMLKQAAIKYQRDGGLVKDVCAEFGVNEREFRDWYAFSVQTAPNPPLGPKEQAVINAAYAIYCDSNADHSFRHCVEKSAGYYGVSRRPLVELWEVRRDVYPTGYSGQQ